jgi:transcription elongation factor Elf1
MTAQICKTCKHKGNRCYCAPNSTCGGYEPISCENQENMWTIAENGCVITCPNCGHRLELCYPDGTEVRYLPHCPWCGKKLEESV